MKWAARLDAYARAEEHLTTQTLSGAVVSIVGFTLMAVLFMAEVYHFATPRALHEMTVDGTRGEKLAIHLNMSFPALPCSLLSLDALDMSGKHEVDIDTTLYKSRTSAAGALISSELVNLTDGAHEHEHTEDKKAPDPGNMRFNPFHSFVNSESVLKIKRELNAKEGCNIAGYLEVERVAGNFHVSVHSQSFHVLEQVFQGDATRLNMSHVIHTLSFGPRYPGLDNPLDHTDRILTEEEGSGTFKYFLKVVPTTYQSNNAPDIPTNQFSVTEYFMPNKGHNEQQLPAVYFMYDLYPISVTIKDGVRSYGHFLTRVCAVVGGVFAVTGMFDNWVHGIVTALEKKT